MKPDTYETIIEKTCVNFAFERGVLSIKVGVRGWPDRLFLFPGGKVWWVELKSPKGRKRALQEHRIRTLKELGHDAQFCNSTTKFAEGLLSRLAASPFPNGGYALPVGACVRGLVPEAGARED